jgi:hypothetical protein
VAKKCCEEGGPFVSAKVAPFFSAVNIETDNTGKTRYRRSPTRGWNRGPVMVTNTTQGANLANADPALVRLAHWLNDHLPRMLSSAGTLGITACGIWFSVKGKDAHWCAWLVALVSAFTWLSAEIWSWCRLERLSALAKQLGHSEQSRLGLEGAIERTSRDYFDLFKISFRY